MSGCPGHEAVELAEHGVRDQLGQLAPGRPGGAVHRGELHRDRRAAPDRDRGAGERAGAGGAGLRRVRLQMLQTQPFPGRLTTSVADGDSLRYYPAYDVPSLASLPPQAEVAARTGRSCSWCSASTGR